MAGDVNVYGDTEGLKFELDGDELVIRINIKEPSGKTASGRPRYGTTLGNRPVFAGGKGVTVSVNCWE